jgi:hypothetical protein
MSIVNKKVLKVPPASIKEKATEGEIINFLELDSENVAQTMNATPLLFIIPFQIVIYTYKLFEFMVFSFIFGYVTMVFFLFTYLIIASSFKKVLKDRSKKKDARMELNTENFNTLKILKLYG